MISKLDQNADPLERDSIVVINAQAIDDKVVASTVQRYPDLSVVTCDSFLSGIAQVAKRDARAVIACVDDDSVRVREAVAGLREACGKKTKLILCCTPEHEPLARDAMRSGADDYIIAPIDGDEIDTAIGYTRLPRERHEASVEQAVISMDDLRRIEGLVRSLDARPMELIEQLASLIHHSIPSKGVTVVVEGAVATAGESVTKPVLAAPIQDGDRVIGQLTVGEPSKSPFTKAHMEKLTRFAELAASVLQASSAHRHWRGLAMTDECTQLPNRRYLFNRLDAVLDEAAAGKLPVTLLLFDVDDFKSFNDTYGHDTGDRVLQTTAGLFRKHCREQDIVARYGGDEFAVVFWDPEGPRVPGSKQPDSALQVLQRVREALKSEQLLVTSQEDEAIRTLTISGGLATYPWDAATRDDLLRCADQALLAAKKAGKNRIFLIGQDTAGP